MKILGIDPGTNVMGYAFLSVQNKKPVLDNMGVIKLDKIKTQAEKLKLIGEKVDFLIESYEPDCMAIEAPFYSKNAQSMLKLGRAQGVAIAIGGMRGLNVVEYAPKKIKMSITGNGNASKEQVASMLIQILKIKTLPKYYDATDALGVALCHHFQTSSILNNKKVYKDWKAFVKDNPKKLK